MLQLLVAPGSRRCCCLLHCHLGGGGQLGGHQGLHLLGRHARGAHGGLEVALLTHPNQLKRTNKNDIFAAVAAAAATAAAAGWLTFL